MLSPSSLNKLYEASPPWFFIDAWQENEKWLSDYLYGREGVDSVVRNLRGKKMISYEGLMNEFGAALQFFEGFGENWNALSECLFYLDEWLPAEAYLLVISRPLDVLADEPMEDLATFLRILNRAGNWWATPIEDNGRFNRPALPFHTILQCQPEEVDAVRERYGELPLLRHKVSGEAHRT